MAKIMLSPDNTRITGSLETVPGIASILNFDSNGEPNYGGETEIDWDGQETVVRDGQRVFVDEDGEEYLESFCRLVDEDEFLEPEDD